MLAKKFPQDADDMASGSRTPPITPAAIAKLRHGVRDPLFLFASSYRIGRGRTHAFLILTACSESVYTTSLQSCPKEEEVTMAGFSRKPPTHAHLADDRKYDAHTSKPISVKVACCSIHTQITNGLIGSSVHRERREQRCIVTYVMKLLPLLLLLPPPR